VTRRAARTLARWSRIPGRLRRAVAGLPARERRSRGGSEGWTPGQYAHHLAEANLVAASIVLAALGASDPEYDWTWLVPDAAWMRRAGYGRLPASGASRLLDALRLHVAAVVRNVPRAMERSVRLRGSAGVVRRTVEEVLAAECAHADLHIADIRKARAAARRPMTRIVGLAARRRVLPARAGLPSAKGTRRRTA
jgi:hypothetical protein